MSGSDWEDEEDDWGAKKTATKARDDSDDDWEAGVDHAKEAATKQAATAAEKEQARKRLEEEAARKAQLAAQIKENTKLDDVNAERLRLKRIQEREAARDTADLFGVDETPVDDSAPQTSAPTSAVKEATDARKEGESEVIDTWKDRKVSSLKEADELGKELAARMATASMDVKMQLFNAIFNKFGPGLKRQELMALKEKTQGLANELKKATRKQNVNNTALLKHGVEMEFSGDGKFAGIDVAEELAIYDGAGAWVEGEWEEGDWEGEEWGEDWAG